MTSIRIYVWSALKSAEKTKPEETYKYGLYLI